MHKRHGGLGVILLQIGKIVQQAKACEHPLVIHDTAGERTDVKGQTRNLRRLIRRRLLQHEKCRFKSLRVIQEISRRLGQALSHNFQIMIAAQPCMTKTLQKILAKGGEKDVEQNVAENDGLGKTILDNAKSYVKHHAQARFTEYFLKEGEHNPMRRRGVQRHDFCANTVQADPTCSVTENMPIHYFLSVMRSNSLAKYSSESPPSQLRRSTMSILKENKKQYELVKQKTSHVNVFQWKLNIFWRTVQMKHNDETV